LEYSVAEIHFFEELERCL